VRAGSVVVSGLAAGIDQAAHEGAFPDTVGVLAFGHDYHYPPENLWLREKMEAEGGLTLSAYAPWESGRKYFFLERNTIMAALSKTVVIMEAPLRSGALHTAEFALDLGRDVFAIPGNPEQLHYAGNLHLIQQGAWPLTHPSELFTDQRSKLPLA
jgi:DNA processing protein